MHFYIRKLTVLMLLGFFTLQIEPTQAKENGQPLQKLEEKIAALSAELAAVKDPSTKYSYLEQTSLGDGRVRTKLFFHEEHSFYDRVERFELGGGPNINALGVFQLDYSYYDIGVGSFPQPDTPLFNCPLGGDVSFGFPSLVQYALHNERGAIHFTTATPNAGRYICNDPISRRASFIVLEGYGVGEFACIEQAYVHGYTFGGYDPEFPPFFGAFENAYSDLIGIGGYTGVFRPETNGLPGTLYLEIIAPDGCIPEK